MEAGTWPTAKASGCEGDQTAFLVAAQELDRVFQDF